jgi:hypothetical protein
MPDVRITRNNHLDRNTPQSAGILRLAAINSDLSSSSHTLWRHNDRPATYRQFRAPPR